MIAFRLVGNSLLFSEPFHSAEAIFAALRSGTRPVLGRNFSPPLRDLIKQCWAADLTKRPTAAFVLGELAEKPQLFFPAADAARFNGYRRLLASSLAGISPVFQLVNLKSTQFEITTVKELTAKGNADFAVISEFQQWLFDGIERDSDAAFTAILGSPFVANSHLHADFVDSFILALRLRYQSLDRYVSLFAQLEATAFVDPLLDAIRRQLRAGNAYPRAVPSLVFLCKLLARGHLPQHLLLAFLRRLAKPGRLSSTRLLYCFFAPEIEADHSLFASFQPAIADRGQRYDWLDSTGHFLREIPRLRDAGWSELLERRCYAIRDEFLSSILSDNLAFVRAHCPSEEGVKELLDGDIFNPCVLLHSRPTLAMYAAAYGAYHCFHHFWFAGGRQRDRDMKYAATIHFAISANCLLIVRAFLHGRIQLLDAHHVAAAFHRNHIFVYFVEHMKLGREGEDHSGRLPITIAAAENNLPLVGYLIGHGVEVNTTKGFGFAALHAAAKAGQCHAIEMLLQVTGINPNIKDIWGTTPLHLAVDANQRRAVELLLQKKEVNVNLRDGSGRTPLYIAARAGRRKIVGLFLQRADVAVNECNKKGVFLLLLILHFMQL
jgi:hypothetical protein